MKVRYPKLYNMTHLLALNVFLLPKGLTFFIYGVYYLLLCMYLFIVCCCYVFVFFVLRTNSDVCIVLWFNVKVKMLQSCRDVSCAY